VSRRADFLLAVQTFLVLRREAPSLGVVALRGAFALPEHAIPHDAATAANEFVAFCNGSPKPRWLAEHEENKAAAWSTVSAREGDRLSDQGREWWNNAVLVTDASHVPPSLQPFLQGDVSKVRVSKRDALAFLDWAATIPGFDYDDPPFDVDHDDAA
jgi:hypothetical protein